MPAALASSLLPPVSDSPRSLLFLALQPVDRALVDGRPLDDPAFTHYVTLAFGLAVLLGALSLFSLPPVRLSRRMTLGLLGAGGVLGVVAVGVVAVLLLSRVDDLRQRLTAEPNLASQVAPGDTRLSSFSPTGRIELWRVAIRMAGEKPVAGAGTGSFSRRWSIERTNKDAYVLQPHSLELETLAELGVIGVAFLAAVLGGVFWCARAGVRRDRAIGASVSGALAAFLLIASVDWVYVFVGLIVPVFLLAGALSGTGKPRLPGRLPTVGYVLVMFVALGVLAGPAMAAVQARPGARPGRNVLRPRLGNRSDRPFLGPLESRRRHVPGPAGRAARAGSRTRRGCITVPQSSTSSPGRTSSGRPARCTGQG